MNELGPTERSMSGRFWYGLVMGWALAVRYARTRAATIAKHHEVNRRLAFLERLIPRR